MADWNKPTTSSTYTNFITEIDARLDELVTMLDGATPTNLPTNAIRFNSSTKVFEKWNGTTWAALDTGYALDAGDVFTGMVSIAQNHATNPGLKVYQLGVGNVVEFGDSTDPDSTPWIIDQAGVQIQGYTAALASASPVDGASVTFTRQHHALTTANAGELIAAWGSTITNTASLNFARSISAAVGTHAAVTDGTTLGRISWAGSDGTNFIRSTFIDVSADGNASTGKVAGQFSLNTMDAAGTVNAVLWVGSRGNIATTGGSTTGSAPLTTVAARWRVSPSTYTDNSTAASGAQAHVAAASLLQQTLAASNTTVTYTNATTLYLDNAPAAGTNITITNPWALYVNAGASWFGGPLKGNSSILSQHATAGLGYATGAGGTVTQITSRTTGVTLNKVSGDITLVSAAGSTSWNSFTLTNSSIAATDSVRVVQKSGTDKYQIHVTSVAAGSCQITFATTSGTTTEQPVFHFDVFKGVNA